jgi:Flp pilus assembly pilin Flp
MRRLRIRWNELGQTLPEYALIIALMAVALMVALTFLQHRISDLFSHVGDLL